MSTLKEFTDCVVERINDKMKDCDVHASLQVIKKNNGVEKIGIVINEKESNVSAVVDTVGFQLAYESGCSMDEIAEKVLALSMEHRQESFDVSQITDYEKVKSRLAIKLINRRLNEEMLKDMPHMNVCDDLACVCYIVLEKPENGKIMVHHGLVEKWNVSVAELMHVAMENVQKMYPAKVVSLEALGREKGLPIPVGESEPSLFVVMHEGQMYGAVVALYKGLLNRLAEEWDSDLILIPSSVHEFLVMQKNASHMSIDEWNRIVNEVNATQLSEDEVLSDHVYLYCKQTMDICSLVA